MEAPKKSSRGSRSEDHPIVRITPVDWKAQGKVTSVKDQGQCGSCWAFAALAVVESSHLIKSSTTYDLSEQQMVNCVRNNYNGCNGGWMDWVYNYMLSSNQGVKTESQVPYSGSYSSCPNGHGGSVKIASFQTSPNKKCGKLRNLVKKAPASVALCANSAFQNYGSGVFKRCNRFCSINHAVVVTGYTANKHWQIKNSWGTSWGVNGYMTLRRGNKCKICNYGG